MKFINKWLTKENVKNKLLQIKWIYSYGKNYWKYILLYLSIGLLSVLISLLTAFTSKDLINLITGKTVGNILSVFIWMICLNIITMLLSEFSTFASNYISMKINAEIKKDVFHKILCTDWEALSGYHSGDLLTRWSTDVSIISSGILSFVPQFCIYCFRFGTAFAVILYYDWTFALFALMGAPITMLLSKKLLRRMTNNNERSAKMGAKITGFNQEVFTNIQTIKSFDLIKLYVNKLKGLQNEYINMNIDFQKMSVGTSLLLSTVGLIVTYSSYGWGIYRVFSGAIDYGTMTMFLALSTSLTTSFHNFSSLVPTVIRLTTSAGRLMDIVEMPREDYSNDDVVAKFLEENKAMGISLKMKDVDYAYKTGTLVFEGASMEVNPHEIIALVGPSGEGKTTMLRLVLSLMQTQEGVAYLTGVHVYSDLFNEENKSLACEELFEKYNAVPLTPSTRKLFSYVPQGNTMFSGTIAENMRNVKEDATDEQIIEALKAACAWEFVEKLPDGINSAIKERGGGFSEGQAQRLSIARALLRDAPILLLDEATSALDVATERKVLRNIMNDERPRTCIVTTHRPTVLSACTRVYAIRDKKCVILNEEEIDEMVRGF